MSDDKLHDQQVRASRAQGLLNDELLKESFDVITRAYLDEWMKTGMRDEDIRESLWHAVRVVAKVRDHLVKVLNDGKLAKAQVDELNSRRVQRVA